MNNKNVDISVNANCEKPEYFAYSALSDTEIGGYNNCEILKIAN